MKRFLSHSYILIIAVVLAATVAYASLDDVPHILVMNAGSASGGNSITNNIPKGYEYVKDQLRDVTPGGGLVIWAGNTRVKKRIQAGKIPQKKDGLINAGAPLVIGGLDGKITFGFIPDITLGAYTGRVLDANGKVLGSFNEDKYCSINLTQEQKNYYLEFCENKTYAYILLKLKAQKTRKIEMPSEEEIQRNRKEAEDTTRNFNAVKKEYMRQHNKTEAQLTEQDKNNIVSLYQKRYGQNDEPGTSYLSGMPKEMRDVYTSYMRKHNIADFNDLTALDHQAIMQELQAKGILPGRKSK